MRADVDVYKGGRPIYRGRHCHDCYYLPERANYPVSIYIKRGEPVSGLRDFVRRDRVVKAKRMTESFVVETGKGWDPSGKKGDWIVLVGGDLWMPVADEQFLKIYRLAGPGDCVGPCNIMGPERRVNTEDRRAPP